jgi:phosphohistidine phosphatase
MKKLFILRHAKSSWIDTELADFDRPLNDRGLAAAPFMGGLMKEKGLRPGVILSSPANRARSTAKLVKQAAGLDAELRLDERIYEAGPPTLCRIAAELDNEFESAMIVGHNPGMEGFIRLLTGSPVSMPTAALAQIDLEIDTWEKIAAKTGRLVSVIRPKDSMRSATGA